MKGERSMIIKHQSTGKATSVPVGLGLSLVVNIVITTAITILIAALINQNKIKWEEAGYWIMFMILLSSFLGAKAAIVSVKTQVLLIAFMSGILYWIFLLSTTALFFGGNYSSVFETAALITSGSVAAALIRKSNTRVITKKKRSSYC